MHDMHAWLLNRPLIILLAFLLDLLLGDPERFFHPVRLIGRIAEKLEPALRARIANPALAGSMLAFSMVAGTGLAVWLLICLADALSLWAGFLLRVYFIYTALSARSLAAEVRAVLYRLRRMDLPKARQRLSRIVGRDTHALSEKEILRATVETTAESTLDGIVSVLFYAFLGGPVLAMMFKAASTLDSMVGYKNERYKEFGWASARLDDAFNFLPARICGWLVGLAASFMGLPGKQAWRIVWRDAANQPSPNSGYPEAAFAGALGVQLGGENSYGGKTVRKETMGDAQRPLTAEIAHKAVKLMLMTSVVTLVLGILMNAAWPAEILSPAQTQERLEKIVQVPYRLIREGTVTTQKRTGLRQVGSRWEKTYRHEITELNPRVKEKIDGYADEKVFREWYSQPALKRLLRQRCKALLALQESAHPSYAWSIRFYRKAFEALSEEQFGKFRVYYRKAQNRKR